MSKTRMITGMTSSDQNPWRTRGSREIYINPWIRVREDQVIRADGQDGIYGVGEFQSYALGIVPVTDSVDTYLIGQWRYPLELYSWETPEGGGALSARRLPLTEAHQMAMDRRITDGVSVIGLARAVWHLEPLPLVPGTCGILPQCRSLPC